MKWHDHFGGDLTASHIIEGDEANADDTTAEGDGVSWTDRRRRDRLREKELLAKVK